MLIYIYEMKLSFTYKKKEGIIMFIYWLIVLVILAKVFTFFETNKVKIIKKIKLIVKYINKILRRLYQQFIITKTV